MQRYVSTELTHFVGRGKARDEQYRLLLTILRGGELRSDPSRPPGSPGARIHFGRHPVGRRPLLLGRILRFPGVVFGAHFPDSPHPETGQLRRRGLPDSLSRALRERM